MVGDSYDVHNAQISKISIPNKLMKEQFVGNLGMFLSILIHYLSIVTLLKSPTYYTRLVTSKIFDIENV